ncbi:unnamed protein product [Wuchereria bancrofti]|uniref:Uncharacterized protein n=1 Tax=Wuchereria bancrofti TaxID=6293 RepID=A0A3P7DKQ6_WUCBA|nr:unnamed protein product [Wuchereria bancrofti]
MSNYYDSSDIFLDDDLKAVSLTKKGKPRLRKPKQPRVYFTSDTEEAIIQYLASTNQNERNLIYNERIEYAFYKLSENIIHTFKFYYTDTDTIEELKHEVVTVLLEKLHLFNHSKNIDDKLAKIIIKEFNEKYVKDSFKTFTNNAVTTTQEQIDEFISKLKVSKKCKEKISLITPPKAFSYFGTIAKRYLINYNEENYKKLQEKGDVEEIDEDKTMLYESIRESEGKIDANSFIEQYIKYIDKNLYQIFPKNQDAKTADAIIELFRKRESLEIFNKKALYIYIREITDVSTPQITKITKKLDTIRRKLFNEYYKNDTIKPLAGSNAGSAVMLMPTIKDLIDVNVKNNEQLIKMAAIAQRAINNNSNPNVASTNKLTPLSTIKPQIGKVFGVVLNEDTPSKDLFNLSGGWNGLGTVFYLDYEQSKDINETDLTKCKTAKPLIPSDQSYPLIGELIYIVDGPSPVSQINNTSSQKYYLTVINIWNNNQQNSPSNDVLGKSFSESSDVRKLISFEGDRIFQGRKGNGIRFGSTQKYYSNLNEWSSNGKDGDPITILTNGYVTNDTGSLLPNIEEINKEKSSIWLTTTQKIPLLPDLNEDVLNPLTKPLIPSTQDNGKPPSEPVLLGIVTTEFLLNILNDLSKFCNDLQNCVATSEGSPLIDINIASAEFGSKLENHISNLPKLLSTKTFTA